MVLVDPCERVMDGAVSINCGVVSTGDDDSFTFPSDIIFKSNHEDGLGIIVAARTEDTLQTDMLAGCLIILAATSLTQDDE
jgi:hypothetical protein